MFNCIENKKKVIPLRTDNVFSNEQLKRSDMTQLKKPSGYKNINSSSINYFSLTNILSKQKE
jgi:hypothetical protein